MLIRHFQPRCLQSSNSIFPSYILKFNRMPAVQDLQLKRKSSITQLPHLLESDPRRPPVHVMQRDHGEERAVRQGHHDRPLIRDLPSAVSLQKSTWTFAAAWTMMGSGR